MNKNIILFFSTLLIIFALFSSTSSIALKNINIDDNQKVSGNISKIQLNIDNLILDLNNINTKSKNVSLNITAGTNRTEAKTYVNKSYYSDKEIIKDNFTFKHYGCWGFGNPRGNGH